MPNYVSTLTGQQITSVMTQIDQGVPEGWAVGEKNGIPVSSSSPYYQNNAKYYAENALDSANRAEAAVPAGTAGAVFFDRVQTLTTAQQEQARDNIKAGGSNRNLLGNPFFSVNQRGVTTLPTVTVATYCVDRWKINRAAGEVQSGGILFSWNGQSSNSATIQQLLEKNYSGYDLTVSINLDGIIYSHSFTFTGATTDWRFTHGSASWIMQLDTTGGLTRLVVFDYDTTPTLIKAVKLEFGNYSTLANDGLPNYVEELQKCRAFFFRFYPRTNYPFGAGFSNTASEIRGFFPIPVSMFRRPTIALHGSLDAVGAGTRLTISSISIPTDDNPNGFIPIAATVSGATADQAYILYSTDSSAYIDISAEP